MSFISKEDFTTHIYEDSIDAISNDDDEKLDTAIRSAEQQVKGYLSRFDIEAIFQSQDEEKETFAELITYIKDIAKWRFIQVCNVNVDLELAEKGYKYALQELKEIQKGTVVPYGWPIKADEIPTGGYTITSRPKRGNYI